MSLLTDAITAGKTEGSPVSRARRAQVLIGAALGPLITGYAMVAALIALLTSITPYARFDMVGVLKAAVPGWLAGYLVPVHIDGGELGVLPLLPAIGLAVLVARAAAHAAHRLDARGVHQSLAVVGTICAAHAAWGFSLAVLTSGHTVTARAIDGMAYPGLLAGGAALVGVLRAGGLRALVQSRVDSVAAAGLRVGALAVAAMGAAGAVALTVGLATSFGTATQLFTARAPGVTSGFGMLLLCAGYLPNAVVAAVTFLAGSGFSLGAVSVGALQYTPGPVLGVPLLAALPEERAPWWPALLLVPIAIGAVCGWLLRAVDERPVARLRAVAVAAMVVGLAAVLAGGAAGGRLGAGPFTPVDLRPALLSLVLAVWIGVPGALIAWLAGPRPQPEPVEVEEPAEEVDDDSAEDAAEAEDVEDTEDTADDTEEPEEAEDAGESPADKVE